MANFFDQFDEQQQPNAQGGANPFDQFDDQPHVSIDTGTALVPAPKPPRGLIETLGDEAKTFASDLSNPDPETKYSTLIPFARSKDGSVRFAPNKVEQGIYKAIPEILSSMKQAVTAPGRILSGEVPEQETEAESQNLAKNLFGLAGAARVPAIAGAVMREAPIVAGGAVDLGMNVMTPVAKAASKGVTAVAQPILDKIDPDGAIARVLAKRVMADNPGLTLDAAITAAQQKLVELGPDAVMADLGEASRNLGRSLINNTGETSSVAKESLGARAAQEPTRVVKSIEENVSPSGFYDVKAANDAAKKTASPFYERAGDKYTSVTTPALQMLLEQEPLVMQGIKNGVNLERIKSSANALRTGKPERFDPNRFGVVGFNESGDPVLGQVTPLRLWHAAREGLDNMLEQYRDKTTGKLVLDKTGRAIQDLRGALSDEIKNQTGGAAGDFAKGDTIYAGASKLNDALSKGRSFARGDEEVTTQYFNGLSPAEKDAYRSGVAQEMAVSVRKLGTTPKAIKTAMIENTEIRDKLKTILPTPEQFNRFITDLTREATFKETNATRFGSKTGSILNEGDNAAQEVAADLAGGAVDIAKGNPMAAGARAMRWAGNLLKKAQMAEPTRNKIGKLLYSKDPKDQAEAFRLLRTVQKSDWRYTP